MAQTSRWVREKGVQIMRIAALTGLSDPAVPASGVRLHARRHRQETAQLLAQPQLIREILAEYRAREHSHRPRICPRGQLILL